MLVLQCIMRAAYQSFGFRRSTTAAPYSAGVEQRAWEFQDQTRRRIICKRTGEFDSVCQIQNALHVAELLDVFAVFVLRARTSYG